VAQTGMQSHRNKATSTENNATETQSSREVQQWACPTTAPIKAHCLSLGIAAHPINTVGRAPTHSSAKSLLFSCPSPLALDPLGTTFLLVGLVLGLSPSQGSVS